MALPPPPPPPPTPNPASRTPGIGDNADITTRFIAKVIDGVVLFILAMIVTLAVTPLLPRRTGFSTGGFGFTGFGVASLIMALVSALIYLAYLAVLESSRGQTVGKMVMKLQVRGPDGGHPSMEAALKRNAWVLLSVLPWFGNMLQAAAAGYIGYTIYDSQNNVGWHDEFAGGTRVVKIG